jgi:hypothetical protein
MRSHIRFAALRFGMSRSVVTALASVLLLAGCGADKTEGDNTEDDPAMSGALGEQIMVDPDMAGGKGAALAANSGQVDIPAEQRSPEAIAAARDEAAKAAGGALKGAPAAAEGNAASLMESAATAAQVAQQSKAASTDCTKKVQYSATWAAKLPAALPVYPRGAVQEAAGTDSDGCALRVVNYVSPVGVSDIMDFYYTLASKGGYGAERRMDGEDNVLGGRKDGLAYVVYARPLANGLTEVDLITSGK